MDNVSILFEPAGAVPTMGPWALGGLLMLLIVGAWWAMKRNDGYRTV